MSKKLIIEENGTRTVIDYGLMSNAEIASRLRAYEEKYGSYDAFFKTYSCADSTPSETTVEMDWECLIEESELRNASV